MMQNDQPRDDDSQTNASSPAEGERRAIGGYYPQYRVAAALILRALREENLESIRVADPEAARLDDIQIASRGRLDAFQVKWSRYGEAAVTFRELTKADDSTPSLVAQLAEGWKRLRAVNSELRVVVHLVTNRRPSVKDHLPGGTRHLAAFIQEVWNVARRDAGASPWAPPERWGAAWSALRDASGFSSAEFAEFVKDCELEFGYELPRASAPQTSDGEIFTGDLKQLTEALFGAISDPAKIVALSRDALLGRVGWKHRVEFRSRHEFPLDEVRYEPIAPTVSQFHAALDALERGYLGLLGSPGAGKSSLLTHALRSRPERVIRYYAYVPDAQDPLQSRGEATNFLHDLVLTLERSGFRVGESLSRFERDQLLNRLQAQFQLLHKDWKTTGRKTVIAIDGLDHIARELRPHHSLLRDLPLPDQVPPGVVIVLGSQTDQLEDLPSTIQGAIREPGRRIEMRSLARDAVYRIVERAGLPVAIDAEQTEDVYRVSSGHPLALALVLNELQNATDAAATAEILARAEPYTGDIERQYHSHWRQIEADDELAHFMGLVARLRRAIDLEWIENWAGPAVVARFRRKFAHYFRKESTNRWYFFHNSFRLFVIKRTRETAPGLVDEALDARFHRELADRCRDSQGLWNWEEVYHLVAAGQHDLVLARATPAFFREQVLALRPLAAVAADIRLALWAVASRHDVVALARLNLANAEITSAATTSMISRSRVFSFQSARTPSPSSISVTATSFACRAIRPFAWRCGSSTGDSLTKRARSSNSPSLSKWWRPRGWWKTTTNPRSTNFSRNGPKLHRRFAASPMFSARSNGSSTGIATERTRLPRSDEACSSTSASGSCDVIVGTSLNRYSRSSKLTQQPIGVGGSGSTFTHGATPMKPVTKSGRGHS